ncbi:MAG: hypothetical protein GXP62_19710 [Oligoflexia bacterium]|nr:hypothetical protein [Oligoflexia bacterium]
MARFVVRFGMTVPAILAIEGMRPLSFVGSQFMHVLTPSIAAFLSPADWAALATLLEDREGLDILLRHIETIDAYMQEHGELPPREPPTEVPPSNHTPLT